MFKRRRQNRKVVQVARMLREVDACVSRQERRVPAAPEFRARLVRAA